MDIKKVKRLNDLTTVEWTKPNGRHTEAGSLEECPDTPKKEFLDQFATVQADLIAKTPFGKKFADSFTLTGVSLTKNAKGRRQFSPSGKIQFGWGEIGVSMPLLLEHDDEGGSTAENVLTEAETRNIDELFALAEDYVSGEREQATLDLEDKEPTDPFDGAEENEEEHELAGAAH